MYEILLERKLTNNFYRSETWRILIDYTLEAFYTINVTENSFFAMSQRENRYMSNILVVYFSER